MTKIEMLKEMSDNNWDADVTEKSSYSEVREEYKSMLDEFESAYDAMYPNGRDMDAEDF